MTNDIYFFERPVAEKTRGKTCTAVYPGHTHAQHHHPPPTPTALYRTLTPAPLPRRLLAIVAFFRRTLGHVPEERKLAAAVAAAATTPTSEEDLEGQQQPPDVEMDVEGAYDPRKSRPVLPYAAAAASAGVAASSRRAGNRGADVDGSVDVEAAAGGLQPSGRAVGHEDPLIPRAVSGDGGDSGRATGYLLAPTNERDFAASGRERVAPPRYCGSGDAPMEVPLWSAAYSAVAGGRAAVTGRVMGAVGSGGGRGGKGAPTRILEVGEPGSVVDVTANGDDGRAWTGSIGEAVLR